MICKLKCKGNVGGPSSDENKHEAQKDVLLVAFNGKSCFESVSLL